MNSITAYTGRTMETRAVKGRKNTTPANANAGLIREYQVASEK